MYLTHAFGGHSGFNFFALSLLLVFRVTFFLQKLFEYRQTGKTKPTIKGEKRFSLNFWFSLISLVIF